ncbi:MAG: DUF2953 domain-containing protein, partial [Tissierellia bacterium]|nr:DUF2953 domain-containing protein [Tissierellia bacterium]
LISVPSILVLLLFLSVKFEIKFVYNNGSNKLNISTSYLFNLFKPELYPFDKKRYRKFKKNRDSKLIIKNLRYRKLINYIWDKSVFKQINWSTKIGFTDAALVGIVYGTVWGFKSILISLILRSKEIKSIDIDVIPIFNENQLDIRFNCIIKIRMVYIIIVWIWFLKLYKGGEEVDRTSNRRVNENYNE